MKIKDAASSKSGRARKGGKDACITLKKDERVILKKAGLSSRDSSIKKFNKIKGGEHA